MNSNLITWTITALLLTQLPGLSSTVSKWPTAQSVATMERVEVDQGALTQEKALPPNAWRGLVPLRSSRADVESLLGKAKTSHGFSFVYETRDETIDVLYSAGPCKLSAVERWNVAADIVIRMDIRPRGKIQIQALHLDKARYPRLPEAHPENWARYMNDEDGVMVETIMYGKDEEVYMITYWPRSESKGLRCSSERSFFGSRLSYNYDC